MGGHRSKPSCPQPRVRLVLTSATVAEVLLDDLRSVLRRGPSLQFAILFGSRARKTARPDSDVDIAIMPTDEAMSLADEHALGAELERIAKVPVDLVRVDQSPSALRWRIARH